MLLSAAQTLALSVAVRVASASTCRDRRYQPFSSTSIWNYPIGSAASYVPANIYTNSFNSSWACDLRVSAPGRRRQCAGAPKNASEQECLAAGCCFHAPSNFPTCFKPAGGYPDAGFHADQDIIILGQAGDPLTPFLDRAWVGVPHCCDTSGPQRAMIPFPHDFVTDCELNNNAAALLLADNVTLLQFQPLYRGTPGSPLMAQYPPTCPYNFTAGWNISVLGEGLWGAHGGSFLSSMGGTLRVGELMEDTPPIAHALKLEAYAHDYYWAGFTGPACYTWPALACDGYARAGGDGGYNGTVPEVRPGTLLAVPPANLPALLANLTTGPARKIATALATHGGYLVDDTAGDSGALCMEPGAISELQAVCGISMNITSSAYPTSTGPTGDFFYDLLHIFQALHAVSNNAPGSIGGGGTPLAPMAPPLCT